MKQHIIPLSHEYFMEIALQQARLAYEAGEVPVGALMVSNQKIIAKAHNQTIMLNDPTAHAEMMAISSAASHFQGRVLSGCTLYVTLEPCPMCASAAYWAQLGQVVYAAADPKRGYSTLSEALLHPKTKVLSGIAQQESTELLQSFFRQLRDKNGRHNH